MATAEPQLPERRGPDGRVAWGTLHYRGDLRGKIEGSILGPNTMGELFVVIVTEYDEQTDMTTAGLAIATIDDQLAAAGR